MFGRISVICFIISIIFASRILAGQSEKASDAPVDVHHSIQADVKEIKSVLNKLNFRFEGNHNLNDTAYNELSIFDIRFDTIPEKCKTANIPINCDEATACIKRNGIYKILIPQFSKEPFLVECDAKTKNGGWIIILRRQDGSENFYRDWYYYRDGFGSIQGEFFIGLEKLHALTNYLGAQELMVVIEEEGVYKYSRFDSFVVGNEEDLYDLKSVGKYSGTAGDSLQYHVGMQFTTREKDNDRDVSNCAQRSTGAWWYYKCHLSNLNGKYGDHTYGKGINWHTYKGSNHSITNVKMMVRRRRE